MNKIINENIIIIVVVVVALVICYIYIIIPILCSPILLVYETDSLGIGMDFCSTTQNTVENISIYGKFAASNSITINTYISNNSSFGLKTVVSLIKLSTPNKFKYDASHETNFILRNGFHPTLTNF